MSIAFWIQSNYPWVHSDWVWLCSYPLFTFCIHVCALHLTKSPSIIRFVYQCCLLEMHVIRLMTNNSFADVASWGSLSKVATFTAKFQMHYAVYSLLQLLLDVYIWKPCSQLTRGKICQTDIMDRWHTVIVPSHWPIKTHSTVSLLLEISWL